MSAVTAKFTDSNPGNFNRLVDFGYTSNVVYDGGYTISQNDNGACFIQQPDEHVN